MLPVRFGITVGSVEFEKVIRCFEIENDVLFERKERNVEVKDCLVKQDGLQGENLSCDVKQGSETIVHSLDSIKDLSLNSDKTSPATGNEGKESIANPRRKVRSNSTPNISSEKLESLWLKKKAEGIRRNSNEVFTKKLPESEKREAIFCHGHKKSGEANRVLAHGNRPGRNRRASLPSCVGSRCRSVLFPRSPTEKMSTKDCRAHTDMNKKIILKRCISGPETYSSNLKEASSSGNRTRRFSLPASKTLEKFRRIVRNGCENDINPSSNIPDDLGKDVSLEHVFRLWNVRLPKDIATDLKKALAHK